MKHLLLGALVIIILVIGGVFLLNTPNSEPIQKLETQSDSSIHVDATLLPQKPEAGVPTTITLSFTDNEGNPITDLMSHHARKVHFLLIGENLETIGHVHPADFSDLNTNLPDGMYAISYTFPEAGKYIVGVDVMDTDDSLSQQFIVHVSGSPRMKNIALNDFEKTKCYVGHKEQGGTDRYVDPSVVSENEVTCPEGYSVTLMSSPEVIHAEQEVRLMYHVMKGGNPVTNLSPYLDAPIHLAIVPESFDTVLHRHGDVDTSGGIMDHSEMDHDAITMDTDMDHDVMVMDDATETDHMHMHDVPESFGSNLISESLMFPAPGTYRVFAQIKHEGQIIVASHLVKVEPKGAPAPEKTFSIEIKDGAIVSGESTLRVTKGDKVMIHIMSDVSEEFHVHGYDTSVEIESNTMAMISLVANISGRFPFELEQSKTELGALEVNPN